MKQLKFVTMAAALFAVMTFTSSCSKSDDDEEKQPAVVTVAPEKCSIIAASNAEVTYTIDVPATAKPSSDKKGALFTNIAADTKIAKVTATLVNADGYKSASQTATVRFSSKMNSARISFVFTKKSTDTKSQDDVATSTEDVVLTAYLSNIEAQLIIPAGTTVTSGNAIDDFSLSAYQVSPNILDADAMQTGKPIATEENSIVLVMDCTPDDATFSGPVTLRVKVGKSLTGETLTIVNKGEEVSSTVQDDGWIEFHVNHFTDWSMVFKILKASEKPGTVTLLDQKNVPVVAGNNTYSYPKKVGIEADEDVEDAILFCLETWFSKKIDTLLESYNEEGSFTSSASGTASIKVIQNYSDYSFKMGEKTFSARLWGKAVSSVTVDGSTPSTNGHSGGSGF